MVAESYSVERIRAVLRRISSTVADATSFTMHEKAPPTQGQSSIGLVLSKDYLVGSVMLWLAYFMGLVIFYALINWMPILFRDAGLSPSTAALITALFPLGGLGAIFSGWLMDRFNANIIIGVCFVLTADCSLHDWSSHRRGRLAHGRGACGRHADEHGPVFVAGTGGGVLPDAWARHGRGLDARSRPIWRDRRFLSRRRIVAA